MRKSQQILMIEEIKTVNDSLLRSGYGSEEGLKTLKAQVEKEEHNNKIINRLLIILFLLVMTAGFIEFSLMDLFLSLYALVFCSYRLFFHYTHKGKMVKKIEKLLKRKEELCELIDHEV